MTTATVLCDNVGVAMPREIGNGSKVVPASSGDGPQQRFADVLPMAQAALGVPAEHGKMGKGSPEGHPSGDQVVAELSSLPSCPVRKKGNAASVPAEITAWLLVEAACPMTHRPTKPDSAIAPVGKAKGPLPKAGMSSDKGAPSGEVAQPAADTQELEVGEQPLLAVARALQMTKAEKVHPARQESQTNLRQPVQQLQHAQGATAGEHPANMVAGATIPTGVAVPESAQVARSVSVEKGQVSSMPEVMQGIAAATATRTVAGGKQGGQTPGSHELAEKRSGVQVVSPSQHEEGEASLEQLKSAPSPGRQVTTAQDKNGQAQVKPQMMNPQPASRADVPAWSENKANKQELSTDGRQDRASKRQAATPSEGLKNDFAQVESKDIPSAGSKETGAVMSEVRVSSLGESAAVSQRPAIPLQTPAGADAAPARTPAQSVGEQILDSVQVSAPRGDRQVLVRLQPPELGTVLVRFQEHGDQLTGTLEVSNRQTRREIEQALPQLVRTLQEAGIQVRRVEVVGLDQSERGPGGEHLPQDTGTQHQGPGQGREYSQGSPQMRWPGAAGEPDPRRRQPVQDEPRASIPQGRIDLLL